LLCDAKRGNGKKKMKRDFYYLTLFITLLKCKTWEWVEEIGKILLPHNPIHHCPKMKNMGMGRSDQKDTFTT
jgi:hypothetical protein